MPGRPSSSGGQVRRLWVFDFDWTVVDENSDTWIHRCAPGHALPPSVRDSYAPPDWVGYMNRVLGYLAEQGVTPDALQAQLETIPWTPGMRELLEAIRDSGAASPVAPSLPAGSRGSTSCPAAPPAAALGASHPSNDCAEAEPERSRPVAHPPPSDFAQALYGADHSRSAVAAAGHSGGQIHRGCGGGVADTAPAATMPMGVCSPQHHNPTFKLRGANEAIILSDANSFFIPWILDADRRAAGWQGPYGGSGSSSSSSAGGGGGERAGTFTGGAGAAGTMSAEGAQGSVTPETPAAPALTGDGCGPDAHWPPPLSQMFLAILTNPAVINPASGALVVSPHHGPGPSSAAPPHACGTCHPNLCKRTALARFLDERVLQYGISYDQVVYVGDGRNDVCPCLVLRRGDVVMARAGFALHKLLQPLAAAREAEACAEAEGGGAVGSGESGAQDGAGRGDEHVYGAASAAATGQGHGARVAGGPRTRQVLQAACVPWSTAYDILEWVRRQDEQWELVKKAGGVSL